MKVLYVAYRHDPRNPDLASGSDYQFYSALDRHKLDVRLLGPFDNQAALPERAIRRAYQAITHKRYAKFPLSLVWLASQALNRVERAWQPDVVFTIFPPSLVFYTGQAPCVYRLDTSFLGWHQNYPEFGDLALKLLVWQEKRAFRRSARVITQSDWTRNILVNAYGVPAEKIYVFPNPASLPAHIIPPATALEPPMPLTLPLKLLLVGRDYKRKGIDIAIAAVQQLNAQGIPADLVVCGTQGEAGPHVTFVGPYRKSVPEELAQYANLYRTAHVLLHPALFEAAGIVPGEAAAFGVPTITNDTGGLGTTVKDGESGVVLPKGSPPEAYVQVLREFVAHPERYQELRRSSRRRYEQELNWDVAGKQTVSILQEVGAARSVTQHTPA